MLLLSSRSFQYPTQWFETMHIYHRSLGWKVDHAFDIAHLPAAVNTHLLALPVDVLQPQQMLNIGHLVAVAS